MEKREFNLLDEPWIRVRAADCTVHEVSLTEVLLHAQYYTELAGELATQDAAMLRLLLAVLFAVFSETDAEGEELDTESGEAMLELWASLWELGQFPEKPVRDYLNRWRDRFWLFDEQYPFYQVPEAKKGTEYTAAKLNGELSESSNKIRLFPMRNSESKNKLTYAEAARWLLYVNAFDDTSSKPREKGLPSPGVGWLGKIGILTLVGQTLFETLMLNFTLLKNGAELWEIGPDDIPTWELDSPRSDERVEIPVPKTLSKLYSLQSRRLLLFREDTNVSGYYLLGGDFFPPANAQNEQMTVWRKIEEKKGQPSEWKPKRHDPSKQIWREFPSIVVCENGEQKPGVISWANCLQQNGCLKNLEMLRLRIVSVQYGDKDFFVTDAYSDDLTLHADLLTELGRKWRNYIQQEIERCEKAAGIVGKLARELSIARGLDPQSPNDKKYLDAQAEQARAQFYSRVDLPFRNWLSELRAEQTDLEIGVIRRQWWKTALGISRRLGSEMVEKAGDVAFVGHRVSGRHYSSPNAYNEFLYQVKREYGTEGGNKNVNQPEGSYTADGEKA